MPDFVGNPQAPVAVNVQATKDTPVTRTINNENIDRVRVTLSIPSLQKIEKDGDIDGFKANISWQVKYNNESDFTTVITDNVNGKASGGLQRSYNIDLSGEFPVDIRLKRNSDDESSAKKQNTTIFQGYTEIIDDKFTYPNSAFPTSRS